MYKNLVSVYLNNNLHMLEEDKAIFFEKVVVTKVESEKNKITATYQPVIFGQHSNRTATYTIELDPQQVLLSALDVVCEGHR